MTIRIQLQSIKEIDSLLELIKSNYANDYRKIWSLNERTIALLLHETMGFFGADTFSIMTILDYSIGERSCELLIRYAGGGLSLLGSGSSEDFVKEMTNAIVDLAKEKNWIYEVEKVKIRAAGSQCPNCKAAYKYPKEKVRDDGTVECQNCGKPFILQA